MNQMLLRLKQDSQAVRAVVQGAFLLLCAWIGVAFVLFMERGAAHPAGAEGFLPIAALLSLKHWIVTGRIHGFHPAGLFIFLAVAGTGLAMLTGHWRTSLTPGDYQELIPAAEGLARR